MVNHYELGIRDGLEGRKDSTKRWKLSVDQEEYRQGYAEGHRRLITLLRTLKSNGVFEAVLREAESGIGTV